MESLEIPKLLAKRSTEHVPTEMEVCISVVLGILGRNIFPTVNKKDLGRGGQGILSCKEKGFEVKW